MNEWMTKKGAVDKKAETTKKGVFSVGGEQG
jgi:hypothetical protein